MLRGNALAKVDGKGRLKVPSAFRTVLEGGEFFVTSLKGRSVLIYPIDVYARIEARFTPSVHPEAGKLRTTLNYYGQQTSMDSQGRILIHPLLREAAQINGEVSVLGMQSYLEIWNHERFQKEVLDRPLTDDDLRSLAELGF